MGKAAFTQEELDKAADRVEQKLCTLDTQQERVTRLFDRLSDRFTLVEESGYLTTSQKMDRFEDIANQIQTLTSLLREVRL